MRSFKGTKKYFYDNYLCDELNDNIDISMTKYRKSHDSDYGTFAITYYNKPIIRFHFSYTEYMIEYILPDNEVNRTQYFNLRDNNFIGYLNNYFNLSIDELLNSGNEIYLALVSFDRRLGKRRLLRIYKENQYNEWIMNLVRIRLNNHLAND